MADDRSTAAWRASRHRRLPASRVATQYHGFRRRAHRQHRYTIHEVRCSTISALADLSRLRADWVITAVGAAVLVLLTMSAVWTGRHAWAIYKLNRGVGDTVFYDAAGRPWFRLDEQRRDVRLEQISTYFKDAVIAVEDHRYYLHPGDRPDRARPRGLLQPAIGSRHAGRQHDYAAAGAHAVSVEHANTYARKLKEAALAVMLEIFLSKREILELYLNRVYLGAGIYGVEPMSQKMLGKPASELTLAEAALIAGIIRAPASYSPWTHFDAARRRSFVVLQRMREEGKITADQEQAGTRERICASSRRLS